MSYILSPPLYVAEHALVSSLDKVADRCYPPAVSIVDNTDILAGSLISIV